MSKLPLLIQEQIRLLEEAHEHVEVNYLIEEVLDPTYLAETIWERVGEENIEPSEHFGKNGYRELEKAIAPGLKAAIKSVQSLHAKMKKK